MTLEEAQTDYDVVIVGAGIVGLTLACHLIDQGLRIAIVNNKEIPDIASSLASQLRVIAITLGSHHYLEELNVWQRLNKRQYAPFRRMQVWESGLAAQLVFDSADVGEACLGYIVKNTDLQHALYTQAKTDNELTWLVPDTLIDVQQEKNQVLLTLESEADIYSQQSDFCQGAAKMKQPECIGIHEDCELSGNTDKNSSAKSIISTRLLVGADGDQSKVRQLADLHSKATDYAQRALIATVQTELMHGQIARQIFLAKGPLAFLPLRDEHYCSIVWSNTPEEVQRLEAMDDNSFCEELTRVFEQRLGEVISTSPRLSYSLKTQEAEHAIKSGVALIGDAAHTIHPLGGQGANLGMADARCLAKVIIEAKQKHRAIGAWHTLRRYERERRFHNRIMMGGVDGIKHLFAASNPVLQKTRQYGLSVVNNTTCLKNIIISYALGE